MERAGTTTDRPVRARPRLQVRRAIAASLVVAIFATGNPDAVASPGLDGDRTEAAVRRSISTRRMLGDLVTRAERRTGYDRSKFVHWIDDDGDGCDTRYEVLIAEATRRPTVSQPGCRLTGGRWRSRYDGVTTTDPSGFDVDHLVPLAEAWDSGARRWNGGTRRRFANDLGYFASLVAVTASSNRSKGDREPHDWLPPNASFRCTYLAQWVAVKWRWRLRVDTVERAFLRAQLVSCGWPRIRKPARAAIVLAPWARAAPLVQTHT
jgi:hypothetical protein